MPPATRVCATKVAVLSASVTVRVPVVVCAALVSVKLPVVAPPNVAASLVPVIVTVTVLVVPSAEAAVKLSV